MSKKIKKRKNENDYKKTFIMDGDGKYHYTSNPLSHLATELANQNKMDEAANLVRCLRPWAQRSTIGAEVIVDRHDHAEGAKPSRRPQSQDTYALHSGEIAEAVANRSAI